MASQNLRDSPQLKKIQEDTLVILERARAQNVVLVLRIEEKDGVWSVYGEDLSQPHFSPTRVWKP